MLRGSIRQRLAVLIALGCVVVFFFVALASIRSVHSELVTKLDTDLTRLATEGAKAAQRISPERGAELARSFGPSDYTILTASATGVRVAIPAGSPPDVEPGPDLSQFDLAALAAQVGHPFTAPSEGGGSSQRLAVAPTTEDRLLIYSASLAKVDQTVHDLTVRLVLICAAGLLGVIVLVLLAGRAIVRPIEQMVTAAQDVGAGDLDTRIPDDQPDHDTQRLAHALNAMLARLEDAFAAKEDSEEQLRQFLSDASHELRTPLTAVRAHAELLTVEGTTSEQRKRSARKILSQAERMSVLVDDLFLLARLGQGKALDLKPVDVTTVVREALEDFAIVDPARPVTADIPGEPLMVRADRERLRQAIDNILMNVRVHTGELDELSVRVSDATEGIALVFRDAGPGLAGADTERVFERFYRADDPDGARRPGAGLGLAIVAGVVSGHGGTVRAEATEPGLAITIVLPRVDTPRVERHPADASSA